MDESGHEMLVDITVGQIKSYDPANKWRVKPCDVILGMMKALGVKQ